MKNLFRFSLILVFYATWWGPVSGEISESSPRRTFSSPQTAFPARVLLAKQGETSSNETVSTLTVNSVRYHHHKKYTRVVLDLTGRVAIKESKNQRTQKATISLANIKLSKRAQQQIKRKNFPGAIAIFPRKPQTVTIVLSLEILRTYKLLTLRHPDRVVVDLFYGKNQPQTSTKTKPSSSVQSKKPSLTKKTSTAVKPEASTNNPSKIVQQRAPRRAQPSVPFSKARKNVLVVIDPGHGGKDPGAIGRRGTREKAITLQISKKIRDLIQQRLKIKVLLTRSKDTFLDLEDRVAFANRKKADLFISVHVNSHAKRAIQGVEIYHFGKASDPRALEVAARENGMKLESDAPPWQFIIADKLNDRKIEASRNFAWTTKNTLVRTLEKHYTVKDHGVKTAPFYVLRFTTMPSILAEVGFVSNQMEEKRLQNAAFQKKLAEGIYQGIHSYLKALRPMPS